MEFKAFPEIKQIGKVNMQITQKIHGTNAQIFIIPSQSVVPSEGNTPNNIVEVDGKLFEFFVGSRTRWIYPGADNYGFAAFVYAHKEEFVKKLGVGQHFGEWAGPGINSGEGLTEKTFVLFDYWKFPKERPLPPGCVVVPVLYEGPMDLKAIEVVMEDLKTNGSKLQPGFMRPEGVVVQAMGTRYKKVFKAEETAWKKPDENYKKAPRAPGPDYSHLLQPVRLEKLLSKDETYTAEYPKSLGRICADYVADLIKEGQIVGTEDAIAAVKKGASGQIFQFIRAYFDRDQSIVEALA